MTDPAPGGPHTIDSVPRDPGFLLSLKGANRFTLAYQVGALATIQEKQAYSSATPEEQVSLLLAALVKYDERKAQGATMSQQQLPGQMMPQNMQQMQQPAQQMMPQMMPQQGMQPPMTPPGQMMQPPQMMPQVQQQPMPMQAAPQMGMAAPAIPMGTPGMPPTSMTMPGMPGRPPVAFGGGAPMTVSPPPPLPQQVSAQSDGREPTSAADSDLLMTMIRNQESLAKAVAGITETLQRIMQALVQLNATSAGGARLSGLNFLLDLLFVQGAMQWTPEATAQQLQARMAAGELERVLQIVQGAQGGQPQG